MAKNSYKSLLEKPLKTYLWILFIFTVTGLVFDLFEYNRKDRIFLIYVNYVTIIITLLCIIVYAVNRKNIIRASIIFVISLILSVSLSNVFLLYTNDALWQYYFLRDIMVFMILLPFVGFLLPRIYVFIIDFIFCIDVAVIWQLSDDSFVKDYALFLIIMMTGFTYGIELFSRKLKNAFRKNEELNALLVQKDKEILEKENQRISDKMLVLKEKVEMKNKELVSKAIFIAEHKEKNKKTVQKLESLLPFIPEDLKSSYNSIIREMCATEKSHWEEFQVRFNEVHKNFYLNIKTKYPGLTLGELRLTAFLKLNLTTKEIAYLTNTTVGSIEVSRSRLRKKLGMDKQVTFSKFLENY